MSGKVWPTNWDFNYWSFGFCGRNACGCEHVQFNLRKSWRGNWGVHLNEGGRWIVLSLAFRYWLLPAGFYISFSNRNMACFKCLGDISSYMRD